MEDIITYYVIIGIAFALTSYIITYRPAMKRTAGTILELLNNNGTSNDFLIDKAKKFTSWQYRIITLLVYLIIAFSFYPVISLATIIKNENLIEGFSDGILNGLLEINE